EKKKKRKGLCTNTKPRTLIPNPHLTPSVSQSQLSPSHPLTNPNSHHHRHRIPPPSPPHPTAPLRRPTYPPSPSRSSSPPSSSPSSPPPPSSPSSPPPPSSPFVSLK
ncbi:hypothetical protein S245_009467, partial [Arachis hypogaea]